MKLWIKELIYGTWTWSCKQRLSCSHKLVQYPIIVDTHRSWLQNYRGTPMNTCLPGFINKSQEYRNHGGPCQPSMHSRACHHAADKNAIFIWNWLRPNYDWKESWKPTCYGFGHGHRPSSWNVFCSEGTKGKRWELMLPTFEPGQMI